jgi:alpha/beta superfamily hydrolase
MFEEILKSPGEHHFYFEGQKGQLEGFVTVPETRRDDVFAILGHPHPLFDGTMQNKVVTTMARAFKSLGIASARFNFRGVGTSFGSYDAGIGESEDMLILAKLFQAEFPLSTLIFAGFSFGSYVAYRAASQHPNALLITVAPSVQNYNYKEFTPQPMPWTILQGEEDEVVPFVDVETFAKEQGLPMIPFPETSHFFHGQLLILKNSFYLDEVRKKL